MFAWLRPNDLVWNYVVNNYLLGKEPPAFDILYWNQDAVRLAAGLHRDFIHLGLENSFARPGALSVLGTPVDLGAVDVDIYAVAGSTDHIVPWENAYRSVRLLGGDDAVRALDAAGTSRRSSTRRARRARSSYRVTDDPPATARRGSGAQPSASRGAGGRTTARGSPRARASERPAPKTLGSREHAASAKAPGTYVHAA